MSWSVCTHYGWLSLRSNETCSWIISSTRTSANTVVVRTGQYCSFDTHVFSVSSYVPLYPQTLNIGEENQQTDEYRISVAAALHNAMSTDVFDLIVVMLPTFEYNMPSEHLLLPPPLLHPNNQ
jgi:hypothetical protein